MNCGITLGTTWRNAIHAFDLPMLREACTNSDVRMRSTSARMSLASDGQWVHDTATITPSVPPPMANDTRMSITMWGTDMHRSASHSSALSTQPPHTADTTPSTSAMPPDTSEANRPMTMESESPRMLRQNMSWPR